MPKCKAQKKDNEPCDHPAIIGDYCGQHSPDKPKCKALTQKKQPCKNPAKNGDYCVRHTPNPDSSHPAASASSEDLINTQPREDEIITQLPEIQPIIPAVAMRTHTRLRLSKTLNSISEAPAAKGIDIKIEETTTEQEFVPKPLQRMSTWKMLKQSWFGKPAASNTLTPNVNQDAEKALTNEGFSPEARKELLGYLAESRKDGEHIYIAISQPNSHGQLRVKIGRTSNLDRRKKAYKKCEMQIVTSFKMPHTIRVETAILKTLKAEYKSRGKNSKIAFIQKIENLGMSIPCPCGKKHRDMFLTTKGFQYPTDYELIEEFIIYMITFEKMDTEAYFLKSLQMERIPFHPGSGSSGINGNAVASASSPSIKEEDRPSEHEQRPTPHRATSEQRALEIEQELLRDKTIDPPIWVRISGRLVR